MLPTDNKNRTFGCAPIRNESDPICSDSFDLDFDLQQMMIAANPFVARQVDKGLKSAQGLDGKEAEALARRFL